MAKVSRVRTRKRGHTYSYIFEAGKTAEGKRKVIEKGGFASREAAYAAGAAAFTDWKHGNIGITSTEISLQAYLDTWLNTVCRMNVRETSAALYDSMIRNHITPLLGGTAVQALTPAMLDKWIRKLTAEGLSFKTLKLILAILKKSLDYAVYPGQLITSNPASYISVPRSAPKQVIQRKIITPDELASLLAKFPLKHPAHIPILLLYHTGMRIGEVIGLTWDMVDFVNHRITVRQQVRYITEKHGYFLLQPKTQAGKRSIDVDPILLQELSRWKALQAEEELQRGLSYQYNYKDSEDRLSSQSKGILASKERINLVCTKPDGSFVAPDVVRWRIRQEGYNSHSFRHTHATLLIEHGASPKGVAGRLGHASTLLTQDLYTHNTEKLQKDTEQIFEQTLKDGMQTKPLSRQNADK